jgi:SAM-dependent methyltransferase
MTTFIEEQKKYWHDAVHLKRKDPRNPLIKAYVEKKLDLLWKELGPISPASRFLDVGAGNGYFTYYLGEKGEAVATDYSSVMLEYNPVKQKDVMDARSLTYPDNSFDAVMCHAVLHHIDKPDRVRVVQEMARVSKGPILIIEPNIRNPIMFGFGMVKKAEWGSLCFTLPYVRGIAEEAGLEIVRSCSWGLLTPNRMPIPKGMLSFMQSFERPFFFGVTNIVIARKRG